MKTKDKIKLNDGTLEEVMASDFPRIYLHDIKERPDGGCTMTFDTNKAFDDLYKKGKGRKRVTEKGMGNYILELFQKAMDKEDGCAIITFDAFHNPVNLADYNILGTGSAMVTIKMPSKEQVEQKTLDDLPKGTYEGGHY